MRPLKLLLPLLALSGLGLARPAFAHGFGERYDLPLPLSYFAIGGGAVVLLSFVVIGAVVKDRSGQFVYPRLNLRRFAWFRAISSPVVLFPVQLLSVFLFFLVITTGLFGSTRPADNFSPTFVWIIWWVGLGFFVALFGNLWALVNPWKVLYGWAEGLYSRIANGQPLTLGRDYPARWGVWPAVGLFLAFAWAENAFGEGGANPRNLAVMALAYTAISFGGMFVFGKHQWLRHGEAFSVVFGILSRFSLTEARVIEEAVCRECGAACLGADRQCVDCYECLEHAESPEFNLRPPVVGLNNVSRATPDVMAMVVLLLATVTFDGFSATPEWLEVQSFFIYNLASSSYGVFNGVTVANTLGLLAFPLAFGAVYWLCTYWMHRAVGRRGSVQGIAAAFVFSLIPIALAYNFAHFLSLLLIPGQQIVPLVSDPFGAGWDLLSTADYLINIRILNARFLWFFSVIVIVVGHIFGVYLAHIRAMAFYPNRSLVMRSQWPMLGLMVAYTVVSLWIVSRPIAE